MYRAISSLLILETSRLRISQKLPRCIVAQVRHDAPTSTDEDIAAVRCAIREPEVSCQILIRWLSLCSLFCATHTIPVLVSLAETQLVVEGEGGHVVGHHLEVGLLRPHPVSPSHDAAGYSTSDSPPTRLRGNDNVEDAKPITFDHSKPAAGNPPILLDPGEAGRK